LQTGQKRDLGIKIQKRVASSLKGKLGGLKGGVVKQKNAINTGGERQQTQGARICREKTMGYMNSHVKCRSRVSNVETMRGSNPQKIKTNILKRPPRKKTQYWVPFSLKRRERGQNSVGSVKGGPL